VKKGFHGITPDLLGAIIGESDAPQAVQAYNKPEVLFKVLQVTASTLPCPHLERDFSS